MIVIEFSPELVKISKSNIKKCKNSEKFNVKKIQIIQSDILEYQFSGQETIFYLYHPSWKNIKAKNFSMKFIISKVTCFLTLQII